MQSKSPQRSRLWSQEQVREMGMVWHREVLRDVEKRLVHESGFPCPFSRNAAKKGLLRFIFAENVEEEQISALAVGLSEYISLSNKWDGSLSSAYPLIVAFSLNAISDASVDSYHRFGWKVLQKLHALDPAPWPSGVARHVDDPAWSMCFGGMPLFCNMSHPAHELRRSRNLGRHFLIVINPRERFDAVAGPTPEGQLLRKAIRQRIDQYDRIPHSPLLATYGSDALEWRQYGLAADNGDTDVRCPFHFGR